MTAPAASVEAPVPASMAAQRLTHLSIEFTPGQARIDDGYLGGLTDLAESAIRSGSRVMIVAGAQPEAATGKAMSQALAIALKRAEAVSLALRRAGVPAERIDISTGKDGDRVRIGLI
jgi:hypothetical protein